jgi:hypothetical protein
MAWMVGGIRKRVKQPVCYHITPNEVNGTAIRLVNEELIKILEAETGGRIVAYCTDMAGCNLGLWRDYGIKADRYKLFSTNGIKFHHFFLHFLQIIF